MSAAVIAALTFPITGARADDAEDKGTLCRQHLRYIGLAIVMYANDNRGWTPAIYPHASELANDKDVSGGAVLAYKDTDGSWKASGLGLLLAGGYLTQKGGSFLYCTDPAGNDPAWVRAFSLDEDEAFITSKGREWGPTDGDGVAELPGNPDALVGGYVLRYNPDSAWGSWKWEDALSDGKSMVSDPVVFGMPDDRVKGHDGLLYNVLFIDGSVRTFYDAAHVVRNAAASIKGGDVERKLSKIFETYFDSIR